MADRHECEIMYVERNMTVPEISSETGHAQSKLRTWKVRYKWDEKKTNKTATPLQKAIVTKNSQVELDEVVTENAEESDGLTDKQRCFCLEYIIDWNGTRAAIRAGYSEKSASRIAIELLTKTHVREYLNKLMAEKDASLIAAADEVLQILTRTLRRQEAEHVVVTTKKRKSSFDKNGKKKIEEKEVPEIVEIPAKLSDVNKAADLLGRRYGLWESDHRKELDNKRYELDREKWEADKGTIDILARLDEVLSDTLGENDEKMDNETN